MISCFLSIDTHGCVVNFKSGCSIIKYASKNKKTGREIVAYAFHLVITISRYADILSAIRRIFTEVN